MPLSGTRPWRPAVVAPASSIQLTPKDGATVIPDGGRVLMPGLIDAHWHTMLLSLPAEVALFVGRGAR